MVAILESYGLEVVEEAFKTRLEKLKTLVQNPEIPLQEINRKLEAMEYEGSFDTLRSYDFIS